MNENPLLNRFRTNYGAIPFDIITTEDYIPAIESSLDIARANIEKIKKNKDDPSFYNVIEALELCSELLDRASGIYFSLYNLISSSDFSALAEIISPILAKFSSEIYTDDKLFSRVKSVYNTRDKISLTVEEGRLLDKTYKSFVRNGALLNSKQKLRLKEIDKELSVLSPKFSTNVLDATNDFYIHIDDENKVTGIPEIALTGAREKAEEKGYDTGWVFTLQMPSYLPVLQYADNRELRKKLSLAYGKKNLKGDFDNREIVLKTVKLRDERAKLLGYENHSAYTLEMRMAESPSNVYSFLEDIYKIANPAAKSELEEVSKLAMDLDGIKQLEAWDLSYYSEKLKKIKFDFDSEELRPYFKSESVIDGVFKVANKMYNISFTEIDNVPKYSPKISVYEVKDQDDTHLGLLYVDLFPRKSKRGGAWMDTFKPQGLIGGNIGRPHILISGNLTPSTPSTPSLLSFDEVRTVFHEFGHALHGLLSDVKYTSLGCTNVFWDFVELPSQIMENWLLEEQTLNIFAKHYETGETIPKDLMLKIKESQTFNAGNFNNRQLSLGLLDMAWHTTDVDEIDDVEKFEIEVMEKTRLLPLTGGNTSTGFSHIFAGGYSSGYYSYKWAEVLDADAFEHFKNNGIFSRDIASSFRENILSKGNTVDPMELYRRFRGQNPDSSALLRRDGLIK